MSKVQITMTVNGQAVEGQVEPRCLLIHFLREQLSLTGPHIGCETSHCGACTVDLDGMSVKSCTVFAVQADGAEVLTVEGMAEADGTLSAIQEGFMQEHGLQCGSKIRSRSSWGIPPPVSSISNVARVSFRSKVNITSPPAGVNLIALSMRLAVSLPS